MCGGEESSLSLLLKLLDDMITPCDDEDPVTAVATAPLFGEDNSMMNLTLLRSSKTMVSYSIYHLIVLLVTM